MKEKKGLNSFRGIKGWILPSIELSRATPLFKQQCHILYFTIDRRATVLSFAD